MTTKRKLELLAPAANAEVAIQAIMHGADAVYMGATSHGARKSASNSIEDIRKVVEFAHRFRAKVYVTVNTIVYEEELMKVERLCRELYRAGVDALIVQDMALLRLDLPPISLHASTQCDIRTPEKARFLQDCGFSQLVLARELTIPEIADVAAAVDVPVECFVHGALCVSYSGRCHASCAATGRSANRGECAQLCRLPYTLRDASGGILSRDRHLLSLRDFNASDKIPDLVEAGASSFKIEGRLKDADYVKNIVAYYSGILNEFIKTRPDSFTRSSFGESDVAFTPNPEKSFNRGFTHYFLSDRRPASIASLLSPKSMGEIITDLSALHNGDGISYFDKKGVYQGVNVNRVEKGKILTGRRVEIPTDATIHRTFDVEWQKKLAKETAVRKIGVEICLDSSGVEAVDERGCRVRLPLDVTREKARRKMDYREDFSKLGNTIYTLSAFRSTLPEDVFIPRSEITALRRRLTELLDTANLSTYSYDFRRKEDLSARYPQERLDFRDNVANSLAEQFYRDHGVKHIERALETTPGKVKRGTVVMTTRHCILRELGMCKKEIKKKIPEPLRLQNGSRDFLLRFNCGNCEMEVLES